MRNEKPPADTVGLPKMLNTTQVAKALGVTPSTLCRWRSQGIGPRVYWLGQASPRYREQDVLDWLERVAA
jgi:predicted DNA-binding transcriptional regulator AlpA